ncbi:uncharacterized protein T551_00705 [Pneumocystis jirovecii RU7]|uniref:Amino acid transporter transmembrane domain-containing protein n=1 Tax=Pneumocystis jirovecii (strain RU7) TaxID=1408657 RepID=A0A0W4ZUH1_PNEJ7|nr:uncharacterized protein T551_00705 [Pneumocystis jirovecii RU7]KTW32023.1 hypothetical protein T551_00705 [Pneumocystis jirovecii RU7]
MTENSQNPTVTYEKTDKRGATYFSGKRFCKRFFSSNTSDEIPLASFLSSTVNLLNTIISAGVFAMPYAMSLTGVVPGIFIIVLSGFTNALGLYFLSCSAAKLGRGEASFNSLATMTFPSLAVVFDLAIGIQCFGVCVSYLILIGDVMPQVVQTFSSNALKASYLISRHFWISVFIFIVMPFTFFRRLDSLHYISSVAMVSIGYMVMVIVVYFFRENVWNTGAEVHFFKGKGVSALFSSISVFTFAFTCQQNIFSVINEIRDNSHKKLTSLIIISIGISGFIYIIVAVLGYLSFGINIPGNIILACFFSTFLFFFITAIDKYSIPVTIARIAIVVLITFSYPLQVYPSRVSFDKVLLWRPRSRGTDNKLLAFSALRFNILTCLILVFSYILAMAISSFEKVLAYVGSVGSTIIAFILPGLFYSKLAYKPDVLYNKSIQSDQETQDNLYLLPKKRFTRVWYLEKAALLLFIYGVLIMIICLISNIIHSVRDSKKIT